MYDCARKEKAAGVLSFLLGLMAVISGFFIFHFFYESDIQLILDDYHKGYIISTITDFRAMLLFWFFCLINLLKYLYLRKNKKYDHKLAGILAVIIGAFSVLVIVFWWWQDGSYLLYSSTFWSIAADAFPDNPLRFLAVPLSVLCLARYLQFRKNEIAAEQPLTFIAAIVGAGFTFIYTFLEFIDVLLFSIYTRPADRLANMIFWGILDWSIYAAVFCTCLLYILAHWHTDNTTIRKRKPDTVLSVVFGSLSAVFMIYGTLSVDAIVSELRIFRIMLPLGALFWVVFLIFIIRYLMGTSEQQEGNAQNSNQQQLDTATQNSWSK